MVTYFLRLFSIIFFLAFTLSFDKDAYASTDSTNQSDDGGSASYDDSPEDTDDNGDSDDDSTSNDDADTDDSDAGQASQSAPNPIPAARRTRRPRRPMPPAIPNFTFKSAPPTKNAVECFGIVAAGQNDNVFVDQEGKQYGFGEAPACHPQASIKLPKGSPYSCERITVGQTRFGGLVKGSLKPNPSRKPPVVCYPYDFVNKQITYMNPKFAVPMK